MPHIWGKKYPSGVGSSSTCIRNQKTSYSWIFSTKPGGQVCKHKFGLPLRLLFYYLACQSTERIPSLQEMLHFFCPLWNQLPQKDPGQKSQEGTAFQQPLRDEILQPVGLLPSVLHTPGRDPAPELQTTLWLTLISGEEGFCKQHELGGSRRTGVLHKQSPFKTLSPQLHASSWLSPSHRVTGTGILWNHSPEMTCFNLSCHFTHSRKDGAMFEHHPLPSCKFLCCFCSLSQAGESQTESEILHDSLEHRNYDANTHSKEVPVWARTLVLQLKNWVFPSPPSAQRFDFVRL